MQLLPPLDPATWEPPSQPVKCGNRTDLPKSQRRHQYLDAGVDIRHRFTGEYVPCHVKICARCGADEAVPVWTV